MCLHEKILFQPICFIHLPVWCCVFLLIFYWPKISPSQFFFQTMVMILKEHFFSLGVINGNLVSEWLAGVDISNALFIGTS